MVDFYDYFVAPSRYSTPTGLTSAATVHSGASDLIAFSVYNNSSSTIYAQVFDATAASGVPIQMLAVPASSQTSFDAGSCHWVHCATGITIGASTNPLSYSGSSTGSMILTAYYKF